MPQWRCLNNYWGVLTSNRLTSGIWSICARRGTGPSRLLILQTDHIFITSAKSRCLPRENALTAQVKRKAHDNSQCSILCFCGWRAVILWVKQQYCTSVIQPLREIQIALPAKRAVLLVLPFSLWDVWVFPVATDRFCKATEDTIPVVFFYHAVCETF